MTTKRPVSAQSIERAARHAQLVSEMRRYAQGCRGRCTRSPRRPTCRCEQRALDLRGELVADLEPLLRSFARGHVDHHNELDDLLQLARIHALRAIDSWQPDGGASLASWVVMYLRSALARERHRTHRGRAHAATLPEHTDPPILDAIEIRDGLADAIRGLLERLDPEDSELLMRTLNGDPGKGAWTRGRIRGLVAHPASGVPQTHVDGDPVARGSTPIDVTADAAALAEGRYPQPGWELLAPCVAVPIAEVMPRRGEALSADLKALCAGCPVRLDCLAAGCSAATWPGTWGGHPLKSRTRIRKLLRSEGEPTDGLTPEHEHS